jgi:hypothetical protein
MLEWKLLRGSHDFPGPDGGTCIRPVSRAPLRCSRCASMTRWTTSCARSSWCRS